MSKSLIREILLNILLGALLFIAFGLLYGNSDSEFVRVTHTFYGEF